MSELILTLSCPDRVGIVYAVAAFLAERDCNIVDSQQFGDRGTQRFFMRVHFETVADGATLEGLQAEFAAVGDRFAMDWELHDRADRSRLLVMVSKHGHCLNDLLYRWRIGALHADISIVVSNHTDFESLVRSYGVDFEHVPVAPESRAAAEVRLLSLVADRNIDVVVLARYMQILSAEVCDALAGRIINIHHSFLPGFKGAKPYHQAYERGVKLIGATAHYVTAGLDEGPIIEQEVARVDHSLSPDALVAVGRDMECLALARAVQWHAEHRVLLNGQRTVVFR